LRIEGHWRYFSNPIRLQKKYQKNKRTNSFTDDAALLEPVVLGIPF